MCLASAPRLPHEAHQLSQPSRAQRGGASPGTPLLLHLPSKSSAGTIELKIPRQPAVNQHEYGFLIPGNLTKQIIIKIPQIIYLLFTYR